ncbi:MAG: PAS domain S-box protein [Rhodospirillales bacterium]|nr:PAS domain S-box protein [Rhodospirillales bacterium]
MTVALKTLTIDRLGKGFIASLVLAALITLVTSWFLVREINNLNTSWAVHERTIIQKQAYVGLLRGAIGYGGMIHNFKNYLIRHDSQYLLGAHKSMLETKIVISGYRVLGIVQEESDALDELENVVEEYKGAITRAEALININFPSEQIDRQVGVDDTPAVRALLRLSNAVADLRQAKAKIISGEIKSLANSINVSAVGIGGLLVILTLTTAWFLRTRLINPLGNLVAAFDRIDPGAPNQARLPSAKTGGDELDKVAAAGNRFLDAVDRHLLERQYAEIALREKEAFISAVVGSMIDGIITIDERGLITSNNGAAENIFGYGPDEMLGKNVNMLMPEPHHGEHDRYLAKYRNGGEAQILGKSREVRGLRKDGNEFPLSLSVNEVKTETGRHFSGIVRDISRFKQAEEKLRQSENLLSTAIETIPDGFAIFDAEDRLVRSNSRFRHLFSRSVDLLAPGRLYEYILREGARRGEFEDAIGREDEWVAEQLDAWKEDRDTYEMHLGSEQWIEATDRLLPGGGHISIRTDISGRKKAEQERRESRRLLQSLTDNLPVFVSLKDNQGRFQFVNRLFETWTGISRNFVVGKTVHDIYPEEQAVPFDIEDREVIDGGIATSREKALLYPDGQTRNVISTRFPIFSASGLVSGLGTINFDITERKQTEKALRIAKAEAEKANDAKSEFLSSMSHELRTPLHAILGFGQMLESDTSSPLTSVQERCVNRILKGGRHLLELINEVLDLAKIEVGHVELSIEDVSVPEVVEECLDMIRNLADARNIKIIHPKPDQRFRMVRADRTRLHQVLLNLLSNAVKYNREGGSITIGIRETQSGKLSIGITDTGEGIPQDKLHKLFEPFNRLSAEKTEIEGTGIGLTVTKQLVELMGGAITFESKVGTGSTVSVEFRLSDEDAFKTAQAAHAAMPKQAAHTLKTAATMLYVEDNPANMELMDMIVGRIDGLTLIQAPNAELGLELAEAKKPDLIIMDINLPGMSGLEAMKKLQKSKKTANIPVFALSAAATRHDIEKGLEAGFREYLTKPIDLEDTVSIIKRVLEAAA